MTDFGAVVAELRLFHHNAAADAVEALLAMEQRLTDHVVQLASERDEAAELRSRIAELEAVIARVKDMADRDDVGAWDAHQGLIALVLAEAPSVVLDGMIREAKAEAWDEGASDGQWNAEHEAMIERGNREAITNPYRGES